MKSQESVLVSSLVDQFTDAFERLRRAIDCFDDRSWQEGVSFFEVPARVAYHTLQCLVHYFRADPTASYADAPKRFVKEWWQMSDFELPSREQVLAFCDDVRSRVMEYLEELSDEGLLRPFPKHGTVLGNITYALAHTMHHQGGLNVLAVRAGIRVDLWDLPH